MNFNIFKILRLHQVYKWFEFWDLAFVRNLLGLEDQNLRADFLVSDKILVQSFLVNRGVNGSGSDQVHVDPNLHPTIEIWI